MPYIELQPLIAPHGRLIMRTFTGNDLDTTKNYWKEVRYLIEDGTTDVLSQCPDPIYVRDTDGEPHELTTNINRLLRQLDALTQAERQSLSTI